VLILCYICEDFPRSRPQLKVSRQVARPLDPAHEMRQKVNKCSRLDSGNGGSHGKDESNTRELLCYTGRRLPFVSSPNGSKRSPTTNASADMATGIPML